MRWPWEWALSAAVGASSACAASACAGSAPRESVATSEPAHPIASTAGGDSGSASADAAAPEASAATPDAAAAALDAGAAPGSEPVAEDPPPPPAGQRYRAAGACVDPMADATRRMRKELRMGKDVDYVPEPWSAGEPDLDGDGTADRLLVGNVANITTTYFVYVTRGSCAHFAGRIEAEARLEAVDGYIKGLRALGGLAPCQPSCCEELMYSEFRYDGTRFRLAKKELRKQPDCSF